MPESNCPQCGSSAVKDSETPGFLVCSDCSANWPAGAYELPYAEDTTRLYPPKTLEGLILYIERRRDVALRALPHRQLVTIPFRTGDVQRLLEGLVLLQDQRSAPRMRRILKNMGVCPRCGLQLVGGSCASCLAGGPPVEDRKS